MEDRSHREPCKILAPVDGAKSAFSQLWIGTWSMGGEGFGPHDLSLSVATLKKAYEKGFRHFDTAGFYAQGRSEELLKKVFSKRRRKVFISTKGGLWRKGRKVWHDATPRALRKALEESLRRLKTDYIDLFQLHWPDPKVPLDESLGAIRRFKEEGLVRFVGAGNLPARLILKNIKPGALMPHQVHFNPVYMDEVESLRAGKEQARCINCVTSPFEQGLLVSPAYLEKKLGKKDVRNRNPMFNNQPLLKRLGDFFEKCVHEGVPPAAAIIRWLLARSDVDIVIPGPRRPGHIDDLVTGLFLDEARASFCVSFLFEK